MIICRLMFMKAIESIDHKYLKKHKIIFLLLEIAGNINFCAGGI